MDAIDRLFLENAKILRIDINPGSSNGIISGTVTVRFGAIPSAEDLEPITRLLSAPGFSRSPVKGTEFDENTYWISLPKTFSAIKVGKALTEFYAEKGRSVDTYLWATAKGYLPINAAEL